MNEAETLKVFKEKLDTLVKNHKGRVVITAHKGPDDDSIASVLALQYYFQNYLKINSEIIYTGSLGLRWDKIPNVQKIKFVSDISEELNSSDLLILLDCREKSQISNKADDILNKNITSVCIDHHKSQAAVNHILKLTYPDVSMSSNAEIIYSAFYKADKTLNTDIAEILLLGIYGDTGNFRFVTPDQLSVFENTKEIIEKSNIKVDSIRNKLDMSDKSIYEIVGKLLCNQYSTEIENWPKLNITYIGIKDLEKYSRNDMSGAKALFGSMFQKSVRGSGWGFIVYPMLDKPGSWSISFRSQPGQPNVRVIAELLNGGGHDAAAAGSLEESNLNEKLNELIVVDKVLNLIKNNQPTLIPA